MVTRRVHKRQMLLIEDDEVTQIIEYTLGYCLLKYNITLHAIVIEANHIHRVDTDADGIRPDFIRDFHSLLARQLNRHYEESDSFFSRVPTSIVHNEDVNDIVRRIVYCMGNPVADGIEREGKNHKGMRKRWPIPDKVIKRPTRFFRSREKGGPAPDEVTLRFTRPPGWEGMSDEELDHLIEKRVLAYEKEQRDVRDKAGKGFRCDVTNEKPDPRSFPRLRHKLFGLSPLIGALDKEKRLKAIRRLRTFRTEHEIARLKKLAGEHDVVFPYGTFQAVRTWNVMVEPPPT